MAEDAVGLWLSKQSYQPELGFHTATVRKIPEPPPSRGGPKAEK